MYHPETLAARELAVGIFLDAAKIEYISSRNKFEPFHSGHEGYAVLIEEVEELWEELKKKNGDPEDMVKEAIQVAAMAMAIALECSVYHGGHRVQEYDVQHT